MLVDRITERAVPVTGRSFFERLAARARFNSADNKTKIIRDIRRAKSGSFASRPRNFAAVNWPDARFLQADSHAPREKQYTSVYPLPSFTRSFLFFPSAIERIRGTVFFGPFCKPRARLRQNVPRETECLNIVFVSNGERAIFSTIIFIKFFSAIVLKVVI